MAYTRNSRLPSAPVIGDSVHPRTEHPRIDQSLIDLDSHTIVNRRIGDDPPPAVDLLSAGFELWLDEEHHGRPRLTQ